MKTNILFSYFNRHPVIFAYLFGSAAKNKIGPLSDIDIAVFVNKNLKKSERFDLRLRMSRELIVITGKDIDIVILNDASVQLSYEVIKGGQLIFSIDELVRLDFESRVMSRYLDRRYYDKRHAEIVLGKIAQKGLFYEFQGKNKQKD